VQCTYSVVYKRAVYRTIRQGGASDHKQDNVDAENDLIRIADENETIQHYNHNEHLAAEDGCVCDHLKTVNRLNKSAELLMAISECLQLSIELTASVASGMKSIIDHFELCQ
jgi:hypothetical protein